MSEATSCTSRTSSVLPWALGRSMSAGCATPRTPSSALGQARAAPAFLKAVDLAAVGLDRSDEIVSLGPLLGLFIHLTTVTACCLAPSLGSGMLSSAEQPWFSVIIQKYAHQLEKLPLDVQAEAEVADVKLIHLYLSQQPLPILTILTKGQAGFPSRPNMSTLEPATALCPNCKIPGKALNLQS